MDGTSAKLSDSGRGAAFGRAIGIGVIAGLRTATAPASVSRAYRRGIIPLESGGLLGLLTKPWVARVWTLNAAGEMIVDKTSWVPSRVRPVALLPRIASGANVGVAIYRGAKRPQWRGAALGGVGALLGSFAGNRARGFAVKATGRPDLAFALIEDAIAVGGGRLILRRPRFGVLIAVAAAVLVYSLRLDGSATHVSSAESE